MHLDIPQILVVAGHDPSAGAGILSDIKTIQSSGGYALGVISAITVQNENEFSGVKWLDYDLIASQIESVLNNSRIDAVKIGIVENTNVLLRILNLIHENVEDCFIVWDPVIKSSTGFLFNNSFEGIEEIIKKVNVITPNFYEFEFIDKQMGGNFIKNAMMLNTAILLKGGHGKQIGVDFLYNKEEEFVIRGEDRELPSKHGTGCVFSSSLATEFSKCGDLLNSVKLAKAYTEKFMLSNNSKIGLHGKCN